MNLDMNCWTRTYLTFRTHNSDVQVIIAQLVVQDLQDLQDLRILKRVKCNEP